MVSQAKPGQVVAGADPMVMVGKNLSVIGTAVASMLDTKIVLEFAARVS
jgi:propanol-preferring alcohol dehydrogenase